MGSLPCSSEEALATRVARFCQRLTTGDQLMSVLLRLRHEPISNSPHGLQMLRTRWIFFDVPPQPHHKVIDSPRIGVFVQSPHIFQNRLARNHPIFALHQIAQQLRLHHRQMDRISQRAQFQLPEVNRLAAKTEGVAASSLLALRRLPRLVLDLRRLADARVPFRGNSSVPVAPFPAPSLSANTRPPWLRAIARTINTPRPVPFTCESERCVTR